MDEKEEKTFKFYELYTEHGTLYIYETYKDGEGSYPETREFFTNEVAQRGYDTLSFDDGKLSFRTRKRDLEGYVSEEYTKELEPHEFYKKIEYFVSTDNGFKEMKDRTYSIFRLKEKNGQGKIIVPPKGPSLEEKNTIALQLLKRFVK